MLHRIQFIFAALLLLAGWWGDDTGLAVVGFLLIAALEWRRLRRLDRS